jgi:hypothetical protein
VEPEPAKDAKKSQALQKKVGDAKPGEPPRPLPTSA